MFEYGMGGLPRRSWVLRQLTPRGLQRGHSFQGEFYYEMDLKGRRNTGRLRQHSRDEECRVQPGGVSIRDLRNALQEFPPPAKFK
jgi:hypothetical protein